MEIPEGGGIVRFFFPEVPLLDGTYSVSVGVRSATQTAIFDWKDQVTQFEVANPGRSTGRVRLPLDVSFRLRSEPASPARCPRSAAPSSPRWPAGKSRPRDRPPVTVGRIDQVIPSLASRDAIGGHVVQLRDLLRSRGFQSDIYYGNATPDRLDYGLPGRAGWGTRPRRAGSCSTSCPSAAAWPTSSASAASASSSTTTTSPRPTCSRRGSRWWARRCAGDGPSCATWPRSPSSPSPTPVTTSGSCRRPATGRPPPCPLLIDLDGFSGAPDPALAARLAAQKARRWGRPALRGQGLAPQGPGRPGQGAGRLPAALRPEGPAPPGGRGHQRRVPDRARALRRRAGPDRRRGDRRVGHPRGADRLLRRRRCLRVPLQPRGVLRAPARVDVPPAAHRRLHQHRRPRDGAEAPGLVLPDKEPARVAAAIDRVVTRPRGCGRCWPGRRRSGWRRSPCPGCRPGSRPPSRPPARVRDGADA